MGKILTTSGIHGVSSHQGYVLKQATAIAKIRAKGLGERLSVETISRPVEARIDANRWILDCDCGGACAAHPDWPDSRCFGCGRVYAAVVFPAPSLRVEIERTLEKQSFEPMRQWTPGQSLEAVREEQTQLSQMRKGTR